MKESEILQQFYRLNRNIRQHYLQTFATLPESELLKDRGASYPSLLDIFVHVLDGYRFWILQVVQKTLDHGSDTFVLKVNTLDEAKRLNDEVTAEVMRVVEGFSEGDLDREIELPWGGTPSRLGDICWHMVEEELQHRGEMNALLWQINVKPPVGEYKDWLEAKKKE